MAYCTLQNLIDRYGERMLVDLTDRGETATGLIDQATVDRALADTDEMINGFAAGRYQTPLSVVPGLIVDIAQMVAIWKLHVSAPDPKIEEDYKQALRFLDGISKGNITLSAAGKAPETPVGNGVRITDRDRPLTEQNLNGFI